MRQSNRDVKYYLLQQNVVSPEVADKHREILHENSVTVNGLNLVTVTYKQVLQDFDVRNWNGRIYTKDVVMKAIDGNPLIQHDIKNENWTAEYGHPMITAGMNELQRQMTIYPPNACNTINKYWVEGNLLMGECTTLAGGYGEVLRDRILTGFPAMASSRAIGGVDASGKVLPGYTVCTFDTVIRPSHATAYQVKGSVKMNDFTPPRGNAMSESARSYTVEGNPDLANYILAESANKYKVECICETFDLSYNTMEIKNGNMTFSTMNESGITKVVMPLRELMGTNYHLLYD